MYRSAQWGHKKGYSHHFVSHQSKKYCVATENSTLVRGTQVVDCTWKSLRQIIGQRTGNALRKDLLDPPYVCAAAWIYKRRQEKLDHLLRLVVECLHCKAPDTRNVYPNNLPGAEPGIIVLEVADLEKSIEGQEDTDVVAIGVPVESSSQNHFIEVDTTSFADGEIVVPGVPIEPDPPDT